MITPRRLTCSILFAFAACASTVALPPGEPIGEEIEVQDSVAFAVVDADPVPFYERTVLVEATVTAVCQKAGCWMQVEDEGRTALVRWESGCGGKYAFPKDLAGRRVLVQGSFYPKQLSEEDAQHIEGETDEDVEIERDGYEFNASAILVIDAAPTAG